MYIHTYMCIYSWGLPGGRAPSAAFLGRGDDTVGKPHRAQIYQSVFVRAYLLIKIGLAVPCRAIRGWKFDGDAGKTSRCCFQRVRVSAYFQPVSLRIKRESAPRPSKVIRDLPFSQGPPGAKMRCLAFEEGVKEWQSTKRAQKKRCVGMSWGVMVPSFSHLSAPAQGDNET